MGSVSVIVFTLVVSLIFWAVIKAVSACGSARKKIEGLDIGEHGMEAYAGFQLNTADLRLDDSGRERPGCG